MAILHSNKLPFFALYGDRNGIFGRGIYIIKSGVISPLFHRNNYLNEIVKGINEDQTEKINKNYVYALLGEIFNISTRDIESECNIFENMCLAEKRIDIKIPSLICDINLCMKDSKLPDTQLSIFRPLVEFNADVFINRGLTVSALTWPNVYPDGRVCFQDPKTAKFEIKSIEEYFVTVAESFFEQSFSTDLFQRHFYKTVKSKTQAALLYSPIGLYIATKFNISPSSINIDPREESIGGNLTGWANRKLEDIA